MKEWAYEEEYRLIIDNTFVKREKQWNEIYHIIPKY